MLLDQFSTVVFAGGGNRCWWQAGLISRLSEAGIDLPSNLIGTSAGAAIASAYVVNGVRDALNSCVALYGQNDTLFRWEKLKRFQVEFAHRQIYPSWIESFITPQSFEAAKASKYRLTAAVTHPSRIPGSSISISVATAAYLVDKNIWHSIHPKMPKYFGLRQGFYPLHECPTVQDGRDLLCAAAAAPPVMPPVHIKGLCAFDGGYTDNAPIVAQSESEKATTLVLLTRHYPRYPTMFRHEGRTYRQPSRPVPVSTWDCTARATVIDAFTLGYEDASRTALDLKKAA
jgi:predicted acylesterase/phospholipase RssA